MVLSPWAVRELRFDESLGKLHGYDFDICMQARAAGKKVATATFRAIHHHSLELIQDPETWIQTYIRLAEKWEDQLPDTGAEPEAARPPRRGRGGVREGDHGRPPDARAGDQAPARAGDARASTKAASSSRSTSPRLEAAMKRSLGPPPAAPRSRSETPTTDSRPGKAQSDRLRGRAARDRVVREPRDRRAPTASTPSTRSTSPR